MERFVEMVNSQKPLTVFEERSILDVWKSFEYGSVYALWSLLMKGKNKFH